MSKPWGIGIGDLKGRKGVWFLVGEESMWMDRHRARLIWKLLEQYINALDEDREDKDEDEYSFAFENLWERLALTSTLSKEDLYNTIFGRRPTGNRSQG